MQPSLAPILGALLLLPSPAAQRPDGPDRAARERVVTIEGQAPGAGATADEQAKQDALRRAVEQACGAFISTQTKVKNYAAIHDKILSFAGGFVTEYEVLKRGTRGDVTFCKVRAKVSTASFEEEWARLVHTIEAEGNPRCVVVVVEDNDTEDAHPPKANGVAQGIIENFFLSKGVQLMDKGASDEVRERDLTLAAINDDINKLAAAAAAFKADVAVRGKAEAKRSGSTQLGGRTLYQWTATINIRAYHSDSAQLIMSNTYTTTKATVQQSGGGDAAIRACAEENVATMLRDVGEAWRKRQNVRRICQVVLNNCTRADYKAFEAALEKVQGVQGVKLRELVNNICQLEVDWSYDLERLVSRIEELKVEGVSYDVVEQTHDRVVLRVVK